MKIARLGQIATALVIAGAALLWMWLAFPSPTSYAQTGGIYVDKQLGRAGTVVYVGEYLTFTIYIRNDSAFTVTTLPLTDQYNQGVLAYADASIPPDTVDPTSGRMDWNDLTEAVGDLAPGQATVVIVGFIAEHPSPAVVNHAAVHDALNSNGEVVGGDDDSDANESVGGSAPVTKTLTEQVGMVVTFTIEVWNHGYTTMTQALLEDTYDPGALAFFYAQPPQDEWDPHLGRLRWNDLTLYTGDIPAHGVVTVTTVFTTIGDIGAQTANQARIVAAGDWYGNDMAGGADDVPITIVDRPTTPTPQPTQPPQPTATPQPTQPPQPTPIPATATPVPTATPLVFLLPETGSHEFTFPLLWIILGLAILWMLGYALIHKRT